MSARATMREKEFSREEIVPARNSSAVNGAAKVAAVSEIKSRQAPAQKARKLKPGVY